MCLRFNISGSGLGPTVAGENDLAQNPFDLAAERGNSLFDARHRFVSATNGSAFLCPRQQPIPACLRWLAAERHTDRHERHALHRLRFLTTILSRARPEITGFSANRPNISPAKSQQRTALGRRLAERQRFPRSSRIRQVAHATIRQCGPQHGHRPRLHQLGLVRDEKFPITEIKKCNSARNFSTC